MITKQDSNNIQDIFKPLFEAITTNFGKVSDELKMQRQELIKLKKFNFNRMVDIIDELQRDVKILRKKLDNKE